MDLQINLAGIVGESIVDGPGIRTVFFAQGCPHNCEGCHNPKTHSFNTGTDITPDACVCAVLKNPLVRAVTFSGGEPFAQAAGFAALAQLLKEKGYEIAAYSGYTIEQLLSGTDEQKRLLRHIDVLVDGKFVLKKRNLNLKFRGSENQRIIDVQSSIACDKAVICKQERWGYCNENEI